MASMILISTVLISQSSIIKNRVELAYNETKEYFTSSNHKPSSVGFRLEMYRTAINNSFNHPILGYGYRNGFLNVEFDTSRKIGKSLKRHKYNHFHNAYLTNLINMGILGLLALLALLLIPLKVFIDHKNKTISEIGILLTLGYISFGLVNILFGDVFMNAFFILYLALILPNILRLKN